MKTVCEHYRALLADFLLFPAATWSRHISQVRGLNATILYKGGFVFQGFDSVSPFIFCFTNPTSIHLSSSSQMKQEAGSGNKHLLH